ncbi:MAG: hypothetical protein SXA11_21105 [Cyanobacteriota bacterium]|nr:hypothetical protein [Cyanobacteriota bacterium]
MEPQELDRNYASENDFLAYDSPPTPPMEEEEDWVIVDFPNAISADSIPVSKPENKDELPDEIKTEKLTPKLPGEKEKEKEEEKSVEEIEGQSFVIKRSPQEESTTKKADITEETKEPATIIQALHECNRDLVKRVTDLETNLEQCQEKLLGTDSLLKEKTEELTATQKQVSRLFYKLEVCQEVIQRQEVLAETLKENWEKSQIRQGELERECALTQQRYNDVCYRAMELENSCRELRSRLYRQQRQTLQFKAALERTLEMPKAWGRGDVLEETTTAIVDSQSQPGTAEGSRGSIVLHPTAPAEPVKPWSAQLQKETDEPKENENNNLSIDLQKQLPSSPTSLEEKGSELSGSEAESVNPNLPSFVETLSENETSSGIPVEDPQTVLQYIAETTGALPEELISQEQLWDFEAETIGEMPPLENEAIYEMFPEDSQAPTLPKSDRISWNIATGEWNTDKSVPGERSVSAAPEAPVPTPVEAAWAPPTIYQKQSQKKQQSTATIDLPTFPRSNEPPTAANG